MKVALVHMIPYRRGGSISYTTNLYKGLVDTGHDPYVYRVGARDERRLRPLGDGVEYRIVTLETLCNIGCPIFICTYIPDDVVMGNMEALVKKGAVVSIHSMNDRKYAYNYGKRPIVTRRTQLKMQSDAVYVPHPYKRRYSTLTAPNRRKKTAVYVGRVSFCKGVEFIIETNRLLPKSKKIVIRGEENRGYSYQVLGRKYPEWEVGMSERFETGEGPNICSKFLLMADFTQVVDDGGGTQYTTMEAWDAGTVPIIHKSWLKYRGIMRDGYNCIAVDTPQEAAYTIRHVRDFPFEDMVFNGLESLKKHDAKKIARKIVKEINR